MSEPIAENSVRPGKFVSLAYSIADEAGNILEHTDLPVGYIHGGQIELIGGMDEAVSGKRAGDRVELLLSADEGFGPYDPSLAFTGDLEQVPPEFRFVGAEVQMQNEQGQVRTFYVTQVGDSTLTVDANHPFAGKTLRVHLRILKVRDPTPEELSQDVVNLAGPSSALH